ncbi:hypothetical protein [Streptomyces halobius]|uniref:Uncharacterized protein n=1 Tax=Streptomyces halobius TaxID=2879846 RepID=A0ABY4LZ48_9ACTN|nr:hypothetical protein [Streptomyces halobius]UQA90777.1 hypothetical protein K9S39_01740 [Streptomyces halobius]
MPSETDVPLALDNMAISDLLFSFARCLDEGLRRLYGPPSPRRHPYDSGVAGARLFPADPT